MDYSNDACMTTFTPGQVARMTVRAIRMAAPCMGYGLPAFVPRATPVRPLRRTCGTHTGRSLRRFPRGRCCCRPPALPQPLLPRHQQWHPPTKRQRHRARIPDQPRSHRARIPNQPRSPTQLLGQPRSPTKPQRTAAVSQCCQLTHSVAGLLAAPYVRRTARTRHGPSRGAHRASVRGAAAGIGSVYHERHWLATHLHNPVCPQRLGRL